MSLVKFQRAVVVVVVAIYLAMPFGALASPTDGTIDPVYKYAWGENIGWVNFGTPEGNVHITDAGMTGYAWGENVGWISLNCSNTSSCGTVSYGVSGDGTGDLAGYAWGENVGWISFDCSNTSSCGTVPYGVNVSPTGAFSGYAWGENIGWLSFNCSNTSSCGTVDYRVQTDYVPGSGAPTPTPTPDDGGGGGGGGSVPPPIGTPGPTASPTPTATPTATPTGTPGPTPSGTPGPTASPTPSPSGTPEPSGTPPPATPTGTPPPGIFPPGIFPDGVQDFINQGLQNALDIAQAVAGLLVDLFEIVSPVVEESAEPVSIFTAIATAISTIVSIAPFIGSASAFGNLLQFLVQGLQNLPIFGVKRRRKILGTVYDAKTKQPVPFAKVDLLNSNFRVLDSQITDLQGRYAFLLTPEYADQKFMEIRIQVHKNEYVFPSVTIKPPSDTILYYNVYVGGTANVDVDVLAGFDLPMDPLKPQIYAVAVKKPLTKLRNFITKLLDILFYIGLVTVPLSYILDPSGFHLAIMIAFFAINIPRFFGLVGRQFGVVVDSSTGAPMPFALITVTDSQGRRVGFTVSDERGRYFLLVPEGDYTLSAFTPATIIPERTFSKQLGVKKGWIKEEIPL